MTTSQAITAVLNEEAWLLAWMQAGYNKAERANYRRRLKEGKLRLAKQEEILEKLGFTVKQEKTWNLPAK